MTRGLAGIMYGCYVERGMKKRDLSPTDSLKILYVHTSSAILRFTPMNVSGTRKCFNCGSFDHLRDRCPRLNRSTADMTGRPARVSRVNAVDNRNATSQPTATRGVCGQHATNDFHTSVVRGVRGAIQ